LCGSPGIGSARVAGHGVAAADTSDGSTGSPSTESSAPPESSVSTESSAGSLDIGKPSGATESESAKPGDLDIAHPRKKGSKSSRASASADHPDVGSTRKASTAPATRTKPTTVRAVDRPPVTADVSATSDASAATPAAAAAPKVVAIEQTAPLAFLQQLPVVGPLLFTPIVVVLHQIPVVSDVLHPFVGFPLQLGLPASAPRPRDVKVVSFDGTQIYVHFMPARGLQPGVKAPNVLDGPGLGLPDSTNIHGTLLAPALT